MTLSLRIFPVLSCSPAKTPITSYLFAKIWAINKFQVAFALPTACWGRSDEVSPAAPTQINLSDEFLALERDNHDDKRAPCFWNWRKAMKTFKNRKISREKVERRKIFAFVLMFCIIKFLRLRLDRNLVASYARKRFPKELKAMNN